MAITTTTMRRTSHLLPRLRLATVPSPLRPLTATIAFARHSSSSSSSKPQQPQDFYTLFPQSIPSGPPPAGPFSIDLRALQREFFALQQRSHPDTPAHVRSADGPSSAFINRAYSTLRDPLQRAQYLLARAGVDVEDERLKLEDPALLLEVLEAQEEVEAAASEEELLPLVDRNRERIDESLRVLETAFADADLETARREAVRLRYWRNVEEAIKAWEHGKGAHVLEH
ncbi:Fe-S protein assembly co-chaperone HscB [Sphaerosporella brunnea]|uniref:Fe-S protein assembly co-chaperone HscB n=1 Tax=Sphaerosporella brunnea TaxID=1250544 RepID=A0A5J5EL16_9PEZI|nr:Fe-S protein assembly co-chaperone HscB [Sphaerosporella brunnea]